MMRDGKRQPNQRPNDLGAKGVFVLFALYAASAVLILLAAWAARALAAALFHSGFLR